MSNGRERNENSDTQQGLKHCAELPIWSPLKCSLWRQRPGLQQLAVCCNFEVTLVPQEDGVSPAISLSLNGNNVQAICE